MFWTKNHIQCKQKYTFLLEGLAAAPFPITELFLQMGLLFANTNQGNIFVLLSFTGLLSLSPSRVSNCSTFTLPSHSLCRVLSWTERFQAAGGGRPTQQLLACCRPACANTSTMQQHCIEHQNSCQMDALKSKFKWSGVKQQARWTFLMPAETILQKTSD